MSATVGPLILVVDPDDLLRNLFRDIFLLEGYAVADQPLLGPGRLREIAPAAVIYGLGFGDESAHLATLRSLLEERPDGCSTVVCTADPAQIERHRGDLTSLGIPIIGKPFDIEQLLRIVRNGIDGVSRANGSGSPATSGRSNGATAA